MRQIADLLSHIEESVLSWMVLQMALTSFLQVLVRYFWGGAITWAEELLRFEIVFVVFAGAGLGVKYGSHISVDVIRAILPQRASLIMTTASNLFCAFISLMFFYYSLLLIQKVNAFGQTTPVLALPKYILYIPFLLGSGVMGLRFLALFVDGIKGFHPFHNKRSTETKP